MRRRITAMRRRTGGWRTRLGAASLATALVACAAAPDRRGSAQYLDRNTAVTFTVAGEPLVFAAVRPELAARVRDYATVAAASMDRNGQIQYVLLIYFWSTLDPRNEAAAAGRAANLVLVADDRRFALQPIADRAQTLPPIDRPPVRHFVAGIYRTDLPTLTFLTRARYLSLVRGEGSREARFALWRDARGPLASFVHSSQ
jgi:hypothetical protein